MNKQEFISLMSEYPQYREDLFIRGFLVTDRFDVDIDGFPFYGNWKQINAGGYIILAHPLTGVHIYVADTDTVFFLLGHAYNPFTLETDETAILRRIADSYGTEAYFDRINELTGVFVFGVIDGGEVSFLTDPSGMQSACCGRVEDFFYLSSHSQLIGDICDLEMDDLVRELVGYKWYGRVMGPYLPADLTPFREIRRVVPDIEYRYNGQLSHSRFWPKLPVSTATSDDEYERVIRQGADILKNNFECIVKKWQHPWLSLTGGIDSNTSFAAANGHYDQIEAFSYLSAPKEVPDAEAARKICEHFNVKHHEYKIPDSNDELADYDAIIEILNHNNGYIAKRYDNETRKRIYLRRNAGCDVEVKNWTSETIRAYWYKHYGRKSMPKLSAKLFRNLYKIFIFNRRLAHKVDRLFEEYIRDFEYDAIPDGYPPADMHYNEVTWGSWGGLNISEMKYCFDITIPYNNRVFLETMFRVPLDKRISDQHHLDMKKYLNRELYDMNVRVVNMKETRFRAFMLNVILTINSILPF